MQRGMEGEQLLAADVSIAHLFLHMFQCLSAQSPVSSPIISNISMFGLVYLYHLILSSLRRPAFFTNPSPCSDFKAVAWRREWPGACDLFDLHLGLVLCSLLAHSSTDILTIWDRTRARILLTEGEKMRCLTMGVAGKTGIEVPAC